MGVAHFKQFGQSLPIWPFSVSDAAGGAGLPAATAESLYALRSNFVLLAAAAVGATPVPQRIAAAAQRSRYGRLALQIAEPVVLLALLVVCTAFLVDGSFNPFLYFRF